MTQTLTRLDEANLPYLDLEDPAVAARPFERVRELARESWIARMPNGYLVLHWDDAKALNRHPMLRTPEGLGLAAQGITDGPVYEWASGTVLGLDGATHDRVRRLAQPGFTPQKLEALRPYAARLFEEIVDGVAPAGRGEAAEICKSYSIRVICRLLEWPDADWERVVDWAERGTEVISPNLTAEQLATIERALAEMRAYTTEQLERLEGRRGDDLGSAIMAAGVRAASRPVGRARRRARPRVLGRRRDPPLPPAGDRHRPHGPRGLRLPRSRDPRRDLL